MRINAIFVALIVAGMLRAQDEPVQQDATLLKILQRLDSLEKQNSALTDEVHALKQELTAARSQSSAVANSAIAENGASQTPLEERVVVNERRIDEQSQTKVESSQKFPVSLTGMLLFNSFLNVSPRQTPDSYYLLNGPNEAGATVRQTLIGLQYHGPSLPGGGKVSGQVSMDFYAGGAYPSNNWLRLRTANLSFGWKNRSFTVGQEKPLISPHEPNSLAEVGVPPLAGSGNLWLWLPQVRYEERLHFGSATGLTAQVALLQTQETYAYVPAAYASSLEKTRPAVEGRVVVWHSWGDKNRIELAPGFHASTSHVAGTSVNSRIASVDWLINSWSKLDFSGAFFAGRNMGNIGAMPGGLTVLPMGAVIPVHGKGGWLQASYPLTSRLTFNLFTGFQNNRLRDLAAGNTVRDFTYAGNMIYHLAPNVLLGFEALQLRSSLVASPKQIHDHYDLSVAYLF